MSDRFYREKPSLSAEMSDFTRGTIVRGNQKAAQQDLLRGRRKRGIITSQHPRDGLVTVHWNGGAYEAWHIYWLEIIGQRCGCGSDEMM